MARGFTRRRSMGRRGEATYVAHLDGDERALVIDLLTDVRHILAPQPDDVAHALYDPFEALMTQAGFADGSEQAADPAMRRLVPDGHAEDPQVAADFRALNGPKLREAKAARIATALDALAAVTGDASSFELTEEQAQALLVSLTDVRLVLAQRLGLESEDDTEALDSELADALAAPGADTDTLDEDQRRRLMRAAYYDFLTWMQESLAHALLRGL